MFKNRSFHVKLVNDKKIADSKTTDATPTNSPETQIIEVANEIGANVIAGIIIYKSLDMLSKVAVHAAQTYIK